MAIFLTDHPHITSILPLGIRKHTLDMPFTKTTGIDPEKKKGSKRSRRRAGFENRIEGKEVAALGEREAAVLEDDL